MCNALWKAIKFFSATLDLQISSSGMIWSKLWWIEALPQSFYWHVVQSYHTCALHEIFSSLRHEGDMFKTSFISTSTLSAYYNQITGKAEQEDWILYRTVYSLILMVDERRKWKRMMAHTGNIIYFKFEFCFMGWNFWIKSNFFL